MCPGIPGTRAAGWGRLSGTTPALRHMLYLNRSKESEEDSILPWGPLPFWVFLGNHVLSFSLAGEWYKLWARCLGSDASSVAVDKSPSLSVPQFLHLQQGQFFVVNLWKIQ